MEDEAHRVSDDDEGTTGPGQDLIGPELLELDSVFEALGHPRRRYLCYSLLEDTEWTLTDLATKVAAWERGVPEHAVSDGERERAYIALYHAHVPKLVDEGIVTFDEETETLTAGEHADQVLAALKGLGATLDADQEAHARGVMDDEAN